MRFLEAFQQLSSLFQAVKKHYAPLSISIIKKRLESDMSKQTFAFISQIDMSDKKLKLGVARRLLLKWLSVKISYQQAYFVIRVLFEVLGFVAMLAGPLFITFHYKEIPLNSLIATALFSIISICFYTYFVTRKRESFQKFLGIMDAAETLKYYSSNGELFGFASAVLTILILALFAQFVKPYFPSEVAVLGFCSFLGMMASVANHFWNVNVNSVLSILFERQQQRVANGSASLLILSSQTLRRINLLIKNPLVASRNSEKIQREVVDNLQRISNALRSHVFSKHGKSYRTRFLWRSGKAFELSERLGAETGNLSVRKETATYLRDLCVLILEKNLGSVEGLEKQAIKTNINSFSFPLLTNIILSLVIPLVVGLVFWHLSRSLDLLSFSALPFLAEAIFIALVVSIMALVVSIASRQPSTHFGDNYYTRDSKVGVMGRDGTSNRHR